jgi:hypothetical protein
MRPLNEAGKRFAKGLGRVKNWLFMFLRSGKNLFT